MTRKADMLARLEALGDALGADLAHVARARIEQMPDEQGEVEHGEAAQSEPAPAEPDTRAHPEAALADALPPDVRSRCSPRELAALVEQMAIARYLRAIESADKCEPVEPDQVIVATLRAKPTITLKRKPAGAAAPGKDT